MKIEFEKSDFFSNSDQMFDIIRCVCNGMMSPKAYRKIFQICQALDSGGVLELGTAGGASIISAALGLKANGRNLNAISVDKFSGGSWGDVSDSGVNYCTVLNRLSIFGVQDNVTLVKSSLDANKNYVSKLDSVSFLVIDADGKIHRDLFNLMNCCIDETLVLIDDYDELVRVNLKKDGNWKLCWKKIITWALVNKLIDRGVIVREDLINGSFFGYFYPKKMNVEIYNELCVTYNEIETRILTLDEIRINFNGNCAPNNGHNYIIEKKFEEFFSVILNNKVNINFVGSPVVRW
ncbi:class I SAM-dependent methyltransferase [Cellvibrio sp. NN19]|uniref:class I SAM-dependent methyltransferase n=1 Tax=Cellvibrio chitinivorans TaxID=3102792 RepID=UPI002B4095A9|nr:class I SAM-dependent methyltransferase [Cellvibrio sp. NN19]